MKRDPQTGRFLKKSEILAAELAAEAPAVEIEAISPEVHVEENSPQPSQFEVGKRITKTLESPMQVFSRKDITGDSKNIGPGSSVILEKLASIGPTGTNIFRVRRVNSDRTYYTTEEKVV